MSDLTISVKSFYGDNNYKPNIFDVKCDENSAIYGLPPNLTGILGPSNVWKVFRKQSELLDYLSFKAHNLNLMPFVFQSINNERLFLAAHPLVFWYYDSHRKADQRHSYEIIRENHPCKLYFDLEFHVPSNSSHNGDRMINTFLKVVFYILKVPCCFEDVLDLDSSTDAKFSHHLIFQLSHHIFQNNCHAGYFVEKVCHEILANIHSNDEKVDLTSGCGVSRTELSELLVMDEKGKSVLFCDRSVYSKNRHFRLYKSSKLGKKSPLDIGKNNKFCVKNIPESVHDEQIFLASLITYFPDQNFLSTSEKISFDAVGSSSSVAYLRNTSIEPSRVYAKSVSIYPEVDKFVQNLISPGKIWRVLSFDCNKTLVYDIVGNRFCQNIGRAHKSNNIMIVVDTLNCVYYQKCHDHDCKGFRSNEVKLPYEICFYLDADNDLMRLRSIEDNLQLLEDDALSFEDCLRISQTDPQLPIKLGENKSSSVPDQHSMNTTVVGSVDAGILSHGTQEGVKVNKNVTETSGLSVKRDVIFSEEDIESEVCQVLDIIEDESLIVEEDPDFSMTSGGT